MIAIYLGILGTVGSLSADFMTFVPVADAGNTADSTGHGSVSYTFSIGKYEVTNSEYVDFLNAVAASDPYGLYSSSMNTDPQGGITQAGKPGQYSYSLKSGFANKPVNFVSYYDDLRFVNWMSNGMGSGNTEDGSYTLLGNSAVPPNAATLTRNAGALFVVPTEEEWYKAAYYQGNGTYTLYPTGSNTAPAAIAPNSTNPNSANYSSTVGGLTDAGAYTLAASHYGTFDQGGNVIEKDEANISGQKGSRGGSWRLGATYLASTTRDYDAATLEYSDIGFRVAFVPEPGTCSLFISAALLLTCRRRRS
jgi:formylglycine-generating enzyme required for sulfatase activity